MKYYFDIEERLVKRVCVEARDEETAVEAVSAAYHTDQLTLDRDIDFEDFNIFGVDNPEPRTVTLNINVTKPKYD